MKLWLKLILCCGVYHAGVASLDAKNFFKKLTNIVTSNPVKILGITKTNPLMPPNIVTVATDLMDNFDVVEDGVLYRSGQLSGKTFDFYIKKYGIKTVINLRGEHPEANWWQQEKEVTEKNNVSLYNISLCASKLTSKKNLKTILNIFDTAPRPMLVHCRVGVDRTGEVAALWTMDQQHKKTSIALKELSIWHRHVSFLHPAKRFLIEHWQGRTWLEQDYNTANYPQFEAQSENDELI